MKFVSVAALFALLAGSGLALPKTSDKSNNVRDCFMPKIKGYPGKTVLVYKDNLAEKFDSKFKQVEKKVAFMCSPPSGPWYTLSILTGPGWIKFTGTGATQNDIFLNGTQISIKDRLNLLKGKEIKIQ